MHSDNYNGCYRPLFALPPWKYVGVDLAPGANVDLVLSDPYDWKEIAPESAEVIVAGQTFEHTEFFWETARQITRTLKPGGLCCIIVPSSGPVNPFISSSSYFVVESTSSSSHRAAHSTTFAERHST